MTVDEACRGDPSQRRKLYFTVERGRRHCRHPLQHANIRNPLHIPLPYTPSSPPHPPLHPPLATNLFTSGHFIESVDIHTAKALLLRTNKKPVFKVPHTLSIYHTQLPSNMYPYRLRPRATLSSRYHTPLSIYHTQLPSNMYPYRLKPRATLSSRYHTPSLSTLLVTNPLRHNITPIE